MIKNISFQTRARAVDHLGREQIADCPTAISELWKNAYDAYARNVELHIFSASSPEGKPVAAIVDDGHGMNEDEVRNKWLVIGTDSKLSSNNKTDDEDCNGLPKRVKQGQKGIGRLSSGAMGSLLLLISKRKNSDYVAVLIDWRLFENPYLLLNDILIPISTFTDIHELNNLQDEMAEKLLTNIEPPSNDTSDRAERIRSSWRVFSQLERDNGCETTTAENISSTIISANFSEKHFSVWPVWKGDSPHGTALFFIKIHDELSIQLDPYKIENDTFKAIKDRFRKTLVGFTDPFIPPERNFFQYKVIVWRGTQPEEIVSKDCQYDWETFCGLEHIIDGQIDKRGIFTGRIKAFGVYYNDIKILPSSEVAVKGSKYVGPVDIKIGSFEQIKSNTSLTDEVFAFWEEQCNSSAGMGVYRDDLRVLPYGREDNDFFEIEYRRSKHAGREFWVSRRLFGRILITKEGNPNLRDKSGREGFIDNSAKNIFKQLVINILMESARRFFGTDSNIRKEILPELNKEHAKREKEEAAKARKTSVRSFQKKLNQSIDSFDTLIADIRNLANAVETAIKNKDAETLFTAQSKIRDLDIQRAELRLPAKPTQSTVLDDKINLFNSSYKSLSSSIEALSRRIEITIKEIAPLPPEEVLENDAKAVRAFFNSKLNRWISQINEINESIFAHLRTAKESQEQRIKEELLILAQDLQNNIIDLADALKRQRELRDRHIVIINSYYEPFVNVFSSLADGIDIDCATRYTLRETERLEAELSKYTSLAQLGITTEIVSHELARWEHNLTSYLKGLPEEIKNTPAYAEAFSTQKELTDSLRFLDTLKLSGRSYSRRDISGTMIKEAIERFFNKTFQENNIVFSVSDKFERMHINDWTSDIYPVFLNIINNSCYWVCQTKTDSPREIKIDIVRNSVIIADSGPGILETDQVHLFQLFFSKRINGRGVGLYLCRRNLAKSNHTIEYISDEKDKILPGANFLITFSGATFK